MISLEIIYEDSTFLVVNKAGGIPVQPDKTSDDSILQRIEMTLKSPAFPVNRLDRPASGCVMIAKSKEAARLLNDRLKS